MTKTYSSHALICEKFYSLTIDSQKTSAFVFENSSAGLGQDALFVGGMFDLARGLKERGLNITLIDYTDEMVELGRTKLPQISISKADLRELPFNDQFDIVYVVGRVFTHMISDADLKKALLSVKNSLKSGGLLFADNYEDSRIQKTRYFNGQVEGEDSTCKIIRKSTTTNISRSPYVVKWDASYSGNINGDNFNFCDSMNHRAFSRTEFASELTKLGFSIERQGDNFDETSFFTLARKQVSS